MKKLHSDDTIFSLLCVEDEAIVRDLLRKVRPHTKKERSKSKMIIPDSLYEKIKDKNVAEEANPSKRAKALLISEVMDIAYEISGVK